MAADGEGTLYIPMDDFRQFIANYLPKGLVEGEVRFGPPRVYKGCEDLEVSYAFSTTEVPPEDWSQKPKALKEWEDYK